MPESILVCLSRVKHTYALMPFCAVFIQRDSRCSRTICVLTTYGNCLVQYITTAFGTVGLLPCTIDYHILSVESLILKPETNMLYSNTIFWNIMCSISTGFGKAEVVSLQEGNPGKGALLPTVKLVSYCSKHCTPRPELSGAVHPLVLPDASM